MYVKRRYGFWMTFSYNYIDFRTLVTIIIPYICYKNYEVIVIYDDTSLDELEFVISNLNKIKRYDISNRRSWLYRITHSC